MCQRSATALLRSSSTATARRKPTVVFAIQRATSPGIIVPPGPVVPSRGLHNASAARLQQGAAAGQGEEGWTGGDGRDGHKGARVLGIVFFSSLVGALALMPRRLLLLCHLSYPIAVVR